MDADTITRARAAVDRLRWADSYADAYRKPAAERVTVGEQALGEMLDAAPALLALAEAVGRWRSAYDRSRLHESSVERMDSAGEANRHLVAIDAALADLAALAGEDHGGNRHGDE